MLQKLLWMSYKYISNSSYQIRTNYGCQLSKKKNVLLKWHILIKRAYLELHNSKWSDFYGYKKLREMATIFGQIQKSKSNYNRLKNLLQVSGRDKIWKIHVIESKFQILKCDTFWNSNFPINREQWWMHSKDSQAIKSLLLLSNF